MPFWEIAKKDLKLQMRDRRALMVLLAFPICFIAILGMTTGQLLTKGDETQKLKIAVVDQSRTKMSRAIIATLEADPGLRVTEHPGEEARHVVAEGDAEAVLVIGPEFQERYEALFPRDIFIYSTGALSEGIASLDMRLESRTNLKSTVRNISNIVFAATLKHIAPYVMCSDRRIRSSSDEMREECNRLYPLTLDTEDDAAVKTPKATAEAKPGSDAAAVTNDIPAKSDTDSEVYAYLVPSYTVMFVFFLVNIMGRSFIHERDLGTLRRLRSAPLRPVSIVLGKTVPFFLISLVQSGLLFLCGKFLFGMSWGAEPVMILPLLVCTSLAATTLGFLVASLVRTDSQVSAYGNMVVILMAGISGCFMPREWLPELMKTISLGTPHAWALIGYSELFRVRVPDLAVVWTSCGWLLAFSAAYFGLGLVRFAEADFRG